MSTTTVAVYTKAEGYPWFQGAVGDLEIGTAGLVDCWNAAWSEFEKQGAIPEQWRGWVRMIVQRSKAPNVKNPPGLLLKMLREGSARDLSKPSKERAQDIRNRECDAFVAKAREEREALPKEKLSLVAGMYAYRAGINVREMMREWERQGCPAQTEFDYPGWDRCLEQAGVKS